VKLEHLLSEIYVQEIAEGAKRPLSIEDQRFVSHLVIMAEIAMGERVLDRELPAIDA
jgi:hypothetical protein